jgi:hypothetical protein
MTIAQVALSNTFNEFRESTNEIITNLNAITGGGGTISTNTIVANTVSANNLTSGRVLIAGTDGLISDDTGLVYYTANGTIVATGNVTAAFINGDGSGLTNAGAIITDDSASSTEKFILFTDLSSGPAITVNVDSGTLSYVPSTKSLKIPVISSNVIFNTTGQIEVPVGATADRLSSNTGAFRFNTDLNSFEGYNGTSWGAVGGGATGGGADQVFYENDKNANNTYTITAGKNAMTTGPLTIANGATITVPSGSRFVIL